jgi:hypothetical protein
MSTISLQFHADRAEIVSWVKSWAHEFELRVAVEFFFPEYRVEVLGVGEGDAWLSSLRESNRISLSLTEFDLTATSTLNFRETNPNILVITPGRQSETELRETMLSAGANDAATLRIWRKIRNEVKASLLSGSELFTPGTGARSRSKTHLYSPGARDLARRGVHLLAVAGWNEYLLDE